MSFLLDEMGLDKVGLDEMGLDEMGWHHLISKKNKFLEKLPVMLIWPLEKLHTSGTVIKEARGSKPERNCNKGSQRASQRGTVIKEARESGRKWETGRKENLTKTEEWPLYLQTGWIQKVVKCVHNYICMYIGCVCRLECWKRSTHNRTI